MENKKILKIQNQIYETERELADVRSEVEFDKLLLEYKSQKKQIYKIEQEIELENNFSKRELLNKELMNLEKSRKETEGKFVIVTKVEEKLYSHKKNLLSMIERLDDSHNY